MGANVKLAEAMGETAKTMAQMNKQMDPAAVAQTMKTFEEQNMRMEMTEESMNDALDDILADSDDESEEQAVIDKVLDEIGIEISGKLSNAPSAVKDPMPASSASKAKDKEDVDIEAMLAQLKS